ncbi:AI-2E family transporter [Mucisphaera sp.]|uniref:AI-2E family transporter n=1 Tax=Mucisphaera sp. TaxID=2913024 RepID=UPI003D0F3396
MSRDSDGRDIWRDPWVGLLVALLALAALIALLSGPVGWLFAALQPVLVPVVLALALAYVLNPAVSWVDRRTSVSRMLIVLGLLGVVAVLSISAVLYATPVVLKQAADLLGALPSYAERVVGWVAERLNTDAASLEQRVVTGVREAIDSLKTGVSEGGEDGVIDVGAVIWGLLQTAGVGFEVIGTTIGLLSYLIVAAGVCLFSLFVFLWRFDQVLAVVPPLVPASSRDRFLGLMHKMDKAVAAVIRGRLLQSLIYGSVLSLGWALSGVPYWLLLGVAGGILNLVPFLGAVVWPIALLLAMADGGSAEGWWIGALVWPTLVYLLAVFIDSWLVEPWVQGSATNLGPLTIMLVVLVGASLGGVVGMLIAIPVAACVRVLLTEEVLPRLESWAASQ